MTFLNRVGGGGGKVSASPFPNILESGLSWIRHKELQSIIQLFYAVIENQIQQPLVHRYRKLPNISRNPDPCTQEDQVPGDQILGAGTYLISAGTLSPVHKRTRSPGTRYLASNSSSCPSLIQVQTGGTSFFNFSSVCSDLNTHTHKHE